MSSVFHPGVVVEHTHVACYTGRQITRRYIVVYVHDDGRLDLVEISHDDAMVRYEVSPTDVTIIGAIEFPSHVDLLSVMMADHLPQSLLEAIEAAGFQDR